MKIRGSRCRRGALVFGLAFFLLASGSRISWLEAQSDGETPVTLNFENADLTEIITFVGNTLGINFMVDPQVAGKVNMRTEKPILKRDLFAVFETILKMNNAAIVKQGSIYQILPISSGIKIPLGVFDYSEYVKPVPVKESKPSVPTPGKSESAPAPGTSAPPVPSQPPVPANVPIPPLVSPRDAELFSDRELSTHIIPVEFVPIGEMQQVIAPFISNGGTMVTYVKANLLIITDFKDNVRRIRQIVSAIDGRVFDRTFVDLIKIKYYGVKEVAEDLAKVVASGAKDLNTGVNIIPVERLNSIFVVANSSRVLEKVQSWIDRLDSPQGRSQQIFVYPVQNSTAGNIAGILSQLYSEGGSGGTSSQSRQGSGRQSTLSNSMQQRSSMSGSMGMGGMSGSMGMGGMGGMGGGLGSNIQLQSQQLGPQLSGSLNIDSGMISGGSGSMRIVVDDLNNSLVISATQPDYEYLLKTIKILDVLPRQVLIEAKVFMVGLNNDLSMGVQWYFENLGGVTASSGTGENTTTQNLRTRRTTDFSIGAATAGQLAGTTVFQVMNAKQLAASLVALQTKTTLKVLEAPSVLALDGQQAKIEVGDEVPISTSTYSNALNIVNTNSYFNQIQYRPTGVILAVSPRITASGMVTMEIAQEVSQVSGGQALTPKITKSSVQTTLIVKDGQGVVIAGVMRDSLSTSRSAIPFLGNIPILGFLFGTSTRSNVRTEIVVLIEAKVIKDPVAHQDATLEFEGRYEDLRKMVRKMQRTFAESSQEAEEQRLKDQEKKEKEEAEQEKKAQEKAEKQKAEEARKANAAEQKEAAQAVPGPTQPAAPATTLTTLPAAPPPTTTTTTTLPPAPKTGP